MQKHWRRQRLSPMLNKELVQQWMTHPVTEALREVMKERIEEFKDLLISSDDPDLDRKVKGIIIGYNDVLDWQPEVVDAEVQREDVGASGSY